MAARHVSYPKASGSRGSRTNSSANICRPPSSASSSPLDAPRRPSSTLVSELKNAKKRSTNPGSRGSSPPDKRVRSGKWDQTFTQSPAALISPAASRNNSITALNPGPPPSAGSKRPNGLEETSSPRSVQHDEASADSVPLRAAPPAPSMIPGPQYDRCISGTINSVRTIKARKQAQATQAAAQARSQNDVEKALQELKEGTSSLKSSEKTFKDDIESLRSNEKALQEEITRLKSNEAEAQATLRKQVEDLLTKVSRLDIREQKTHQKLKDVSHDLYKGPPPQAIINDVREFIGPIDDERGRTGNTLVQRVQQMEDKYDSMKEKYNLLADQLQKLTSLTNQMSGGGSGQARIDEAITSFNNKQAVVEKRVSDAVQKICSLETLVNSHEGKISTIDTKVNGSDSRIASLDGSVKEHYSNLLSIDHKVKQNGEEIMSLRTSHDSLEKSSSETKQRLLSLQNSYDMMKKSSTEINKKISLTESQTRSHNQKISSLEASHTALAKSSTEAMQKFKHDAEKQLSALNGRISEAQVQLQQSTTSSNRGASSENESINNQVNVLSSRVDQLETNQREISSKQRASLSEDGNSNDKVNLLSSRVDQLETNQSAIIDDIRIKDSNIATIYADLDVARKELHEFSNMSSVLRNEVPDMTIRRVMDQIGAQVKEQVERLKASESSNNGGLLPTEVKAQVESLDLFCKDLSSRIVHVDTTLQTQNHRIDETNSRFSALDNFVQSISRQSRESTQSSSDRFNVLTMSVQNLEKRYENITTDKLHQQMVHWITQNYPHAPDFLNQLRILQRQVERVVGTEANIAAIIHSQETHSKEIASMAESIHSLTSLPFDQVKQFCASQPQLFAEIFQLRANIEAINKRLPGGSLRLDWNIDFSKPPSPPPQNDKQG